MTKKEYSDLIDEAAKVSGENNNFIVGCRDFLDRAGFLTPKQIKCLTKPLPPLSYQFDSERPDYDPSCYYEDAEQW